MKAAVYQSPHRITIQDLPKPKINSREILVEMKACGVCGSDLMHWYLKPRAPLVLGHEPAGVVVQVGSNVKEFEEGDRVFAHHHVGCLTCHFCKHGDYTLCTQFANTQLEPGGFAEYFKVPELNLKIDTMRLPPELSFPEATLIEPVGCCIRALNKCHIKPGDTAVIVGAGPSGIIHTALLRLLGASQIIVADFIDYRLRAARRFGADLTVNLAKKDLIDEVKRVTEERGADVAVVTAPNSNAYLSGIEVCRRGGTICIFAPTHPEDVTKLSFNKLFFSELKLVSSYSTSHVETEIALKLIQSKRIDAEALITHKFPLNQTAAAFQLAAENRECIKVVVLNEQ